MEINQTLSLTQVFDLLRKPSFVKNHGQYVEENGLKMFTAKVIVNVFGLGSLALGTAYFEGQKEAFPVMFLSSEQVKFLRSHGIRFPVKKRKHPTVTEKYISFPNRAVIERMEKLQTTAFP